VDDLRLPQPELLGGGVVDFSTIRPQPALPSKLEHVEFFKTRADAKSVAFVVDCSGSMAGESFERARAELARSIINLQTGQSFYVVFFNHEFIPMFDNFQNPFMAEASPDRTTQVIDWMSRLHASGGTNPGPALLTAARLAPDVIYLLTDGVFEPLDPSIVNLLTRQKIVVHTLGFGIESDTRNLRTIATQTGGTYRAIALRDAAATTLYLAPAKDVFAALRGPDVSQRRAAIEVIVGRHLPEADEMFALLGDSDASIRKAVHDSLVASAAGSDFGPDDNDDRAEVTEAIARWSLWWKWRTDESTVRAMLASDKLNECWVATALARQLGLEVPAELIALLGHPSGHVRRESRAALVQLAGGADFGPDSGADSAPASQAIARWNLWRELRQKDAREIAVKLASNDENECWVAAALARQQGLNLPDELINDLRHPAIQVRREVHAALVRLAGNDDFGPDGDADAARVQEAVTKWSQWRARTLVQSIVDSAQQRGDDPSEELIKTLGHSSAYVRGTSRAALVRLAGGADFGPDPDVDAKEVAAAASRWKLWREWRKDKRQIADNLDSDDINACWVAAVLARQEGLDLPDELIKLLAHPAVQVRREAHAALVHLARDADFGPDSDADATEIQEAVAKWREWRAETVKQAAAARAAAREAKAARRLEVAKQIRDKDRQKERYAAVIEDYPDTEAAAEAQKLLGP
jgi:phage terminase small subunit